MPVKSIFRYVIAFSISLFLSSVAFADNTSVNNTTNAVEATQTMQAGTPLAQTTTTTQTSTPTLIPNPPDVAAKAYVLMDANTGAILAQKNMDEKLPPASLTKMMTLYLTSSALQTGNINLDDKVLISKKAWKMGGSKMFVRVNDHVAVKDLIQGVIVDSGNDACVALSEHVAGSEDTFVNMMNDQAHLIGMNNTHYTDCTGMPHPDHYTTAHDLSLLARALILNFPDYYQQWYSQKWFKYNGIRQPNRNRLLWRYPNADGIKTGHTDSAGFCLVSSAKKDNLRLIAVVMGTKTDEARATTSIELLKYGFRFYHSQLIFPAGVAIAKPRVYFGKSKTVPAGSFYNFYITTPMGQLNQTKTVVNINRNIKAPIKKGQILGNISVTLNGKVIESQPIVALQDNPTGGLFRKSYDSVAHLLKGWFKPKSKVISTQPSTDN